MGETVDRPSIPLDTLANIKGFMPIFDAKRDTLFLRPVNPRQAASFDWNGEVWIRIDLITNEIVGLEIENFESVFLKKYPELAKVWAQAKPGCLKRPKRENRDCFESFVMVLLGYIASMLRDRPQQLALSPT